MLEQAITVELRYLPMLLVAFLCTAFSRVPDFIILIDFCFACLWRLRPAATCHDYVPIRIYFSDLIYYSLYTAFHGLCDLFLLRAIS